MAVIAACGIGQQALLRPIFTLVLIVGGFVCACSLYLSPMSSRVSEKIAFDFRSRTEVTGIVTGSFMETHRGRGVYFTERFDEEKNRYEQVFVHITTVEKENVVVAEQGYGKIDEETGDQFLVLENGTRYEGKPGQPDYRVTDFESYSIRLRNKAKKAPNLPIKAYPTLRLVSSNDPKLKAELHTRMSRPIATGILALFALIFSSVSVRGGRATNLLMAFLIYFSYFNALGVVSSMMKKGVIEPHFGLWVVHLLFLLLAIWLFVRRAKGQQLLPRFKRRRRRQPNLAGA